MGILLIVIGYLIVMTLGYLVVLLVHALGSMGVALVLTGVVVVATVIWLAKHPIPINIRATMKVDFERQMAEIRHSTARTQRLMEEAAREAKDEMDKAVRGN